MTFTVNVEPGMEVTYTGNGYGYPLDFDKALTAGLTPGGVYYVQAISVDEHNTYVRLLGHPGWHNSANFEPTTQTQASAGCDQCNQSVASSFLAVPGVSDVDEPEPEEREYFIEATIQTIVKARDGYAAGLELKDRLAEFIADGYAKNDPMHGSILNIVEEIPAVD